MKVMSVEVQKEKHQLIFINPAGEKTTLPLSDVQQFSYRKGNQFWIGFGGGALGGALGGLLANAGGDDPIWYGIGPGIVAGGLVGGIIGAFIPKYKELQLNDTQAKFKVKVDPVALRLTIEF